MALLATFHAYIVATAPGSTSHDTIAVHYPAFKLVTRTGENVLHENFDRRRLADNFDGLALKVHASEIDFEIEFLRSYPIFAPDAIIQMTGRVRNSYAYVV